VSNSEHLGSIRVPQQTAAYSLYGLSTNILASQRSWDHNEWTAVGIDCDETIGEKV
jgi:hypothetical protein